MTRNSERHGQPAEDWADRQHVTDAVNQARYGEEVEDMEEFLK